MYWTISICSITKAIFYLPFRLSCRCCWRSIWLSPSKIDNWRIWHTVFCKNNASEADFVDAIKSYYNISGCLQNSGTHDRCHRYPVYDYKVSLLFSSVQPWGISRRDVDRPDVDKPRSRQNPGFSTNCLSTSGLSTSWPDTPCGCCVFPTNQDDTSRLWYVAPFQIVAHTTTQFFSSELSLITDITNIRFAQIKD